MADVSHRIDRAQLILVSGLVIAVTLLVLVLLLNTVIYTENVATRGVGTDGGDAISSQQAIESELERLIAAEQALVDGEAAWEDEWNSLSERVEHGTEHTLAHLANRSVMRGTIAETESNMTPGIQANRSTTALTENTTFASNLTETRMFSLTIDPNTSDTSATLTDQRNENWTANISVTSDQVNVSSDGSELCSVDHAGEPVTLHAHNQTLVRHDGQDIDCGETLWGGEGTPSNEEMYDITLETEDGAIEIAFNLIAGGETVAPGEDLSDDEAIPFVYRLTVEYTYVTSDLTYETTFHMEGEPT